MMYDRIGVDYALGRRPDPRWQGAVDAALGTSRSVLNVGAGTGLYEPSDRYVVAVELSRTMIAQRPWSAGAGVTGSPDPTALRCSTFTNLRSARRIAVAAPGGHYCKHSWQPAAETALSRCF